MNHFTKITILCRTADANKRSLRNRSFLNTKAIFIS